MSSTRTLKQLCTATPILLLFQCQVSFRLLPSSVAMFILIENRTFIGECVCVYSQNLLMFFGKRVLLFEILFR